MVNHHQDKYPILFTCFSITNSHLSQVTEVVSLHFQIEYFGLSITGFSDQKFI